MTTKSNKGLSRRAVLLQGAACATGAAAILTAATNPALANKLPKSAVGYQDKPHGAQKCSTCTLFQPPHSCKSVAGTISPNGWCRIYHKA